jgi:non-ribosomal peptide synthetase component F
LYFDNSTFDVYTAFAAGATLHLVPPGLNAVLPRLAGWISENAISVFFCVPSVLTLLLQSRRLKGGAFPALREVIFAGEVVQPDVLTRWMTLYPQARFTNMYGPTEITVDCSYHVVETPPGTDPVPIGRARPNMELLVYTDAGELTATPGATGELWVRGLAVGYGYLGDEERTRKAFVQHPCSPFTNRLYRTGDLVSIREDGNFMFLGRADQQVKYLGHRIELGEIEAQLQALPEVEEAVVVFRQGNSAGEQGIGALVSVREGVDAGDVLAALRHRVPSYMLPKRILCTRHSFPRTPNGKYDRNTILATVFSGDGTSPG